MAVSIIGTPLAIQDGGSYTAETGSNRVLCYTVGFEEFNSVTVAPTFGGVAFVQGAFLEGNDRSYLYIGYILEANIPSGSQTLALVPSAAVDDNNGVLYTLSGVDQTTVGTAVTLDSTPATASPVLNLTGVADGIAVALLEHDSNSTITADVGWTTDSLNVGTTHRVYAAHKTATAGADTFSPTISIAQEGVLGSYVFDPVVGGLTLDSAPSTMAKAETGVSFVVSTPATVPTTGNTTVISSGDALTVTSVTGSDPYTINCTVPIDITKQVGSYAWTITVDAENVVSSSIPLTVQAGWTNLVLASPLTTSGYMLEGYTGDVPVTGDTMEYETTTDLSPDAASQWIWDTAPTVSQVVGRRVVQVDGTVGTTADITFTVAAPSTIPAASRTSVFHIAAALRALETFTHTQTNELVVEWLESEGISRTTLNGMLYGYLGGLGYTGSIDDRMKQWREAG